MPPGPPPDGFKERPRDWLDDIADLDFNDTSEAVKARPAAADPVPPDDDEGDLEPACQDTPRTFEPQPDYWPRPHMPATIARIPEQAEAAISHGTRRLLYNTSAAAAGWGLGLYDQLATALADCGANYSIGGALVLGFGGCALIAHVWDRRTRHWWPGIAWVARIPLATAILALALWAPAAP
jgi:hypothetical protein